MDFSQSKSQNVCTLHYVCCVTYEWMSTQFVIQNIHNNGRKTATRGKKRRLIRWRTPMSNCRFCHRVSLLHKKFLLFDPSKAIGSVFFSLNAKLKPRRSILYDFLSHSQLSHSVLSMGRLWCQRRRQQTISIPMLQLIIAIISINSIQTWHLAWFLSFLSLLLDSVFSSFFLSLSLFGCFAASRIPFHVPAMC